MQTLTLAGSGIVLLLTVGVGIVAHELSHAAVPYLLEIQRDITIGSEETGSGMLSKIGATHGESHGMTMSPSARIVSRDSDGPATSSRAWSSWPMSARGSTTRRPTRS